MLRGVSRGRCLRPLLASGEGCLARAAEVVGGQSATALPGLSDDLASHSVNTHIRLGLVRPRRPPLPVLSSHGPVTFTGSPRLHVRVTPAGFCLLPRPARGPSWSSWPSSAHRPMDSPCTSPQAAFPSTAGRPPHSTAEVGCVLQAWWSCSLPPCPLLGQVPPTPGLSQLSPWSGDDGGVSCVGG